MPLSASATLQRSLICQPQLCYSRSVMSIVTAASMTSVAAAAVTSAKRKLYTLVLLAQRRTAASAAAPAAAAATTSAAVAPLSAPLPSPPLAPSLSSSPYSSVLLGLKLRGFGAGKFNGFGGKVEPGERIRDAAMREMKEEAGIESDAETSSEKSV